MNAYGNEYGYHTPDKTKKVFKLLTKSLPLIQWEDSSWHNDLCDSIYVEIDTKKGINCVIYLPNSPNDDSSNEEYNRYVVYINQQEIIDEEDFDKVIKLLRDAPLSELRIDALRDKHEAIRTILMDNGNVEYGDCIIDEICEAVGIPPTTIYYVE